MNKYIIPFTTTVSLLGCMLPAQHAHALESTNSVQGEVNSQVWLDNRYCPTTQGEATYYLNDFNANDGGFAITLNYADTHTLRLETNVKRLTFCAPEYFGLYRSYFKTGEVLEEGEFDEGQRHGELKEWDSEGNLSRTASYHEGNLHGVDKRFFADGEIGFRGTKVGRWVERTDYQKVIEHYNDSGELDGMREEFNADGDLVVREHYADGVLHGGYLRYSDEQLVAKGEFVEGKREGDWAISLFYAGGLIQQGHYVNDKQVGRWTVYDEYGHRRAINQYNDEGQLHGRQLEFEGNGSLRMLKEYRAGREHGIWVYYHHGSAHGRSRHEDGYYVEDIDDNIEW